MNQAGNGEKRWAKKNAVVRESQCFDPVVDWPPKLLTGFPCLRAIAEFKRHLYEYQKLFNF